MTWCDAPLIILCWVSMSQFFYPLLFLWSLLLVTWTIILCLLHALHHLQIMFQTCTSQFGSATTAYIRVLLVCFVVRTGIFIYFI